MPPPNVSFSRRQAGLLLVTSLVLLPLGCRPVREAAPPAPTTPGVNQPVPAGYTRYRVIPGKSDVRVLVYREGPMARLGHNHVLRSQALVGDVILGKPGAEPRFSLVLPVASFSVDEAGLRAEEGEDFPAPVSDDAIAGTRKNLLSEALLDGAKYPDIRLKSSKVSGLAPDYSIAVAVEIRGQVHKLQVPVHVVQRGDELQATGHLTVTHGQLGLTPFTVMGGLLSVRDEIRLRFRIVAQAGRTASPAPAAP